MKKIDYPREQLSVRLETELAKAFKIALIQRGETAEWLYDTRNWTSSDWCHWDLVCQNID